MNLNGKWIGEYSQLSGNIKPEPVTYDSFEIDITDIEGELTGQGKDITLENEPFTISGFYDSGVLSFIKKYERYVFQNEEGDILADNDYESMEIHYSGSFIEEENLFQGTWEMHLGAEQDGLQDSYIDEYETGMFYLRRAQ